MRLLLISITAILLACSGPKEDKKVGSQSGIPIQNGDWRFSLQLEKYELPFNVKFLNIGTDSARAIICNGEEELSSTYFSVGDNKIRIVLPVFDSELIGNIDSENLITGYWLNKSRKDYKIPFVAEYGKKFRFSPTLPSQELPSRYRVVFEPNSTDKWDAILMLNQENDQTTGTFLTETGDYRYLEGNIINNKLYLSTFDGSHAFLFHADIKGDSLVNGEFISGTHYSAEWKGKADKLFQLRRPQELTYLKDGYKHFDFRLPNQDGDTVTWDDLDLDNKVVIVDIMGSWCPNCMDANIALKELTANYSSEELVVIPIAFETTENLETAKTKVFKMQNDLGLENRFLFGGFVSKEKAAETFPMLNHVMSYPTLIFIGKDQEIKEIYTGFYGPGTGKYHEDFMLNTKNMLENLVND